MPWLTRLHIVGALLSEHWVNPVGRGHQLLNSGIGERRRSGWVLVPKSRRQSQSAESIDQSARVCNPCE
jgi:hypothetical protein